MRLSVTPSTNCSCSSPPPRLANGSTTIEHRGGPDFCGGDSSGAGRGSAGSADLERIDAQRLGDVFELLEAEIADGEFDSPSHLPVGVLGERDRAGRGDAFEPRGDIHAVAHQVAIGLLDDVAEMDADPKLDAAIVRKAGVALDETVLHLDAAAHRIDDAPELDQHAVAGAFHHPAVVNRNAGVDQIAAESPEPGQNAVLVGAGKPGVADNVGHQYRRELARHNHQPSSAFAASI